MKRHPRITILPATLDDVRAVVALWRESFVLHRRFDPVYFVPDGREVEERLIALARQAINDGTHQLDIARDDETNEVVGFAIFSDEKEEYPDTLVTRYTFVHEVYVAQNARDGGVGAALMATIEEWSRARGIAYVQLNVSTPNDAALRFYKRLGFYQPFARMLKSLQVLTVLLLGLAVGGTRAEAGELFFKGVNGMEYGMESNLNIQQFGGVSNVKC